MLAGSHRNAWPDETGTGGRTNRNTQVARSVPNLRKNRFNIRLNSTERAIIGVAAAIRGITIPQFIRETIRRLIEELNACDSPDDCVRLLMGDVKH